MGENHAENPRGAESQTHRLDDQVDRKVRNNAVKMIETLEKPSLEGEEEEKEESWRGAEKRSEGLGRWARLGTSSVLARQQTEGLVRDRGDRWPRKHFIEQEIVRIHANKLGEIELNDD